MRRSVIFRANGPTISCEFANAQAVSPENNTLRLRSQAFSLGYAKDWPFGPKNNPLGRKTTTSLTLNVCWKAIDELGNGTRYHQPVNDCVFSAARLTKR
jgi:hypothetical protein